MKSLQVDLVVVSSTSYYLVKSILESAGPSVSKEYNDKVNKVGPQIAETDGGNLASRKILFLHWDMHTKSADELYLSIRNFVAQAVQHAIRFYHTSISFPAIGCGKINADMNIIAYAMLVEAQKQMLEANILLQIFFVIEKSQADVFQAFQSTLKNLKQDIGNKCYHMSYNFTSKKCMC
jgi:O-acetyl-ADP-ribose deacetylase (regulator of RNase III)